MNVIARLEYELAYYDSAVHHFNHYTTRTPSNLVGKFSGRYEVSTYPRQKNPNHNNKTTNKIKKKKCWKGWDNHLFDLHNLSSSDLVYVASACMRLALNGLVEEEENLGVCRNLKCGVEFQLIDKKYD